MEKNGVNGDVSLTDGVLKMSNASPRGRTRTTQFTQKFKFCHHLITLMFLQAPVTFCFLQSNLMVLFEHHNRFIK